MGASDSQTFGIAHLTVVPRGFDPEAELADDGELACDSAA